MFCVSPNVHLMVVGVEAASPSSRRRSSNGSNTSGGRIPPVPSPNGEVTRAALGERPASEDRRWSTPIIPGPLGAGAVWLWTHRDSNTVATVGGGETVVPTPVAPDPEKPARDPPKDKPARDPAKEKPARPFAVPW